ncbi:MAG: hypothetical protein ACLUNO_12760 [Oscillospiraceae bacterium]
MRTGWQMRSTADAPMVALRVDYMGGYRRADRRAVPAHASPCASSATMRSCSSAALRAYQGARAV